MSTRVVIVPDRPFDDGVAEGRKREGSALKAEIRTLLGDPLLKPTLGSMSLKALAADILSRLETPPDTRRFPELGELYPDRLDYLRGLAKGAKRPLSEAALWHYLRYRLEIQRWYQAYNDLSALMESPPEVQSSHCSGVLLVGPEGVLGAHSMESPPPQRRPTAYRWKAPPPFEPLRLRKPRTPRTLTLVKPRTGYIQDWGVVNEKGVGCCCSNSCGVWLDEPIEDTWPLHNVPLLRWATTASHLAELYQRYTLHNWGRASQIWADIHGQGVVIEKSFRRIGIRRIGADGILWCTEGHWESPEMNAYLRQKRLEFLRRTGRHLGSDDMQYATDCAVRFTRLGELCHEPLGKGIAHMNRILTDHAPFPRAICRHGGPDTAAYDQTVTQMATMKNLSHNHAYERAWVPWRRFPCQVPWTLIHYPPIPG